MQSKERRCTKWREKMRRGKCEEMKRASVALQLVIGVQRRRADC